MINIQILIMAIQTFFMANLDYAAAARAWVRAESSYGAWQVLRRASTASWRHQEHGDARGSGWLSLSSPSVFRRMGKHEELAGEVAVDHIRTRSQVTAPVSRTSSTSAMRVNLEVY